MDRQAEAELLNAVLAVAGKLGIGIEIEALEAEVGDRNADALVRIGRGRGARTYAAEIKRGIRPATLGPVLHQLERFRQPSLLIADYVTPPVAETLKAHGIAFLDAAGNAFVDQPPIHVWVKGERPLQKNHVSTDTTRAFRPSGLKVLFALLCHREWVDQPYRELAKSAGVAHGTVGAVMADLKKLGFVATLDGHRRLLQQERLLKQWTEAFIRTLRPKLGLGRYRTDLTQWWANLDPRKYAVSLGGEPAAQRITARLRPETITLYGKRPEPRLLLDYRLRAEPTGPVEFLRRFWAFDVDNELVPLPLIYADLLMTGDARSLEAADLIYEQILDGLVG